MIVESKKKKVDTSIKHEFTSLYYGDSKGKYRFTKYRPRWKLPCSAILPRGDVNNHTSLFLL